MIFAFAIKRQKSDQPADILIFLVTAIAACLYPCSIFLGKRSFFQCCASVDDEPGRNNSLLPDRRERRGVFEYEDPRGSISAIYVSTDARWRVREISSADEFGRSRGLHEV